LSVDELINNCKKDKRTAQEELYRRYSPVLFGICLKYSRNRTEAEDSLHDCFMTIYDKVGQFNFKGSFEGWMKRIAINTVLQKYRRERRLDVVSENYGDVVDVTYEREEVNLSVLLNYIQELPNKYRITFSLYVLDGYSHKEISNMLGTSEGTSKSNLARARIILKEKIQKENINIA